LTDLLEVAERTRQIPMLLEDYLARGTTGKRAGWHPGGGHALD
jgi:hypothetical protein